MANVIRAHELDELNAVDLEAKLREAKEELFNLRFQAATGQLESHGRCARSRRTSPGSTPWCVSASSASGPPRVRRRRTDERVCTDRAQRPQDP